MTTDKPQRVRLDDPALQPQQPVPSKLARELVLLRVEPGTTPPRVGDTVTLYEPDPRRVKVERMRSTGNYMAFNRYGATALEYELEVVPAPAAAGSLAREEPGKFVDPGPEPEPKDDPSDLALIDELTRFSRSRDELVAASARRRLARMGVATADPTLGDPGKPQR